MAGVFGNSSWPIIGCVTLLVGVVLHILSFASPYWVDDSGGDFGLWRRVVCVDKHKFEEHDDGCYKYERHWDVEAWLDWVRAMECVTVILWAWPLVVLPVYIYVSMGLYYRCVLGTMTVFTLVGAVTNGIGVLVAWWNIQDEDSYSVGWCLYTCLVSCGLGLLAALVFLVSTCQRPKFPAKQYYLSGLYVDPDRNRLYIVETLDPVKEDTFHYGSQANPVYTQ